MRNYSIRGIVLKSSNYKDTDKLYCILSYELGKIYALGKGVRKISSRRAGNLDTLNLISTKISESNRGFKQIQEVKTINSFRDIKKSYELSCKAYYLAELLYRNVEEGEDLESILDIFIKSLKAFKDERIKPDLVVNYFELELLKTLGYEFQFSKKESRKDIINIISKLQKGIFPNKIDSDTEKEIDKIIKSFLNEHLDQKIKSLELNLK